MEWQSHIDYSISIVTQTRSFYVCNMCHGAPLRLGLPCTKLKILLVAGPLARVTGPKPVSRTIRPDCRILLYPPVCIPDGPHLDPPTDPEWRHPVSTAPRLLGGYPVRPCALDPPPRYKRLRGKSPAVGYGYPSRPHLPGKAVTSTPGLCKRYYRAQRPLVVLSTSK